MKKKVVSILISLVMVISSFLMISSFGPIDSNAAAATLTTHDPIRIDGDGDFTSGNGVSNPGAAGTALNPYIIEDWNIYGGGEGYCIYVGNTTKHFVIRNCELYDASGNSAQYFWNSGIALFNVINAKIENNNIYDNEYGIYLDLCSGYQIKGNVFEDSSYQAIYSDYSVTNPSKHTTLLDMVVEDNEFYMSTSYACYYLYIDIDYGYTGPYNINIGDIKVLNNDFDMTSTSAYGIDIDSIYVYDLNGGTITMGDVIVTGNWFYEGQYGLDFYGDFYGSSNYITNVIVTVGDVIFDENICYDQSSYACYLDYYNADNWDGTTTGTFGDIFFRNNVIDCFSGQGIYVSDLGYWDYYYDTASITVGDLVITGNEIYASNYCIYLYYYYLGYEIYHNAKVTMGDTYINNNYLNSDGSSSIIFDYSYSGCDVYDNAQVTVGDVFINDNNIESSSYAIYIYYYECGYYVEDNAKFTIGIVDINNNEIFSNSNGIYFYYYEVGEELSLNAIVDIGNVSITDNVIDSSSDAIYFYYEYFGYALYEYSQVLVGDVTISGNTIESGSDGIYIYYYDYEVASYMEAGSYCDLPSWFITGNTFDVSSDGIYFYTYENPYENYDDSWVDFGEIYIEKNYFEGGSSNAIELYSEEIWYDAYDSTSGTFGDINILDNEMHGFSGDTINIALDGFVYSWSSADGVMTMGDINIIGNIIDGGSDGIDYYADWNSDSDGTMTAGTLTIESNDISGCSSDGMEIDIYVDASSTSGLDVGKTIIQKNKINKCGADGINLENTVSVGVSATLKFGTANIESNDIRNCGSEGIYINDVDWATITNNHIVSCGSGIYLYGSENNSITYNTVNDNKWGAYVYHNKLIANDWSNNNDFNNNSFANWGPNTDDESTFTFVNTWHYNFYSDYTGRDVDGDYIGDTDLPYIIDTSGREDWYPRTKITTSVNTTWNYALIQDAVDNVGGTDIYVAATTPNAGSQTLRQTGFYYENVDVNDFLDLNFVGEGMDWTYVDARGSGDVFDVYDTDHVSFSDMTIQKGNLHGIHIDDYGTNLDMTNVNASQCSNDGVYYNYDEDNGYERYYISQYDENGYLAADNAMPVIDSLGNVHIVWHSYSPITAVYGDPYTDDVWYSCYDSTGNLLIDDTKLTFTDGDKTRSPEVVVDASNNLHIIWMDDKPDASTQRLWYTKINPYLDDMDGGSAIQSVITVVEDKPLMTEDNPWWIKPGNKEIEIDSVGNLHIVFFDKDTEGMFYIKMNNNGNILIGPTQVLDAGFIGGGDGNYHKSIPSIAVDSKDDIHITWSDEYQTPSGEIFYMMLDGATGNIMINRTPVTSSDNYQNRYHSLMCDSQNKLHIVFQDKGTTSEHELYYMKFDPSRDDQNGDKANFNQLKIIPLKQLTPDDGTKTAHPFADIDSQNNIHLVYYEDWSWGGDVWYMKLDSSGNIISEPDCLSYDWWSTSFDNEPAVYLAIDKNNQPHFTFGETMSDDGYSQVAYLHPNGWGNGPQIDINIDGCRFIKNTDDGFETDIDYWSGDYNIDLKNTWFFDNGDDSFNFDIQYADNVMFTIDNCVFQYDTSADTGDYHIRLDSYKSNLDFSVTNCLFMGEVSSSDGYAIYASSLGYLDYVDINFVNNRVENMYYGIYFEAWYADTQFVCTDNEFHQIYYYSVYMAGTYYAYGDEGPYQWDCDIQIDDNEFTECDWSTSYCIYLNDGYSEHGTMTVNNNYFRDCYYNIYIDDTYGDWTVETNNNEIYDAQYYAIYYYGNQYGTLYWDCIGNYIGSDDDYGIYMYYMPEYGTAYVNINYNTFEYCDEAIYLYYSDYGKLYLDMIGNEMYNCDTGFYLGYVYNADIVINWTDGYMYNIDDTCFEFDDEMYHASNVEFNVIDSDFYGYENGFEIDYGPYDGSAMWVTIDNCYFESFVYDYTEYWFYEASCEEGFLMIDVYDTTVIGYDDYLVDFDGNDEGTIMFNCYDCYFEDKIWPDIYADYDFYMEENCYVSLYNTVGANGVYFNDYPSWVKWYYDLTVNVMTGVNLDQPAPNVEVGVNNYQSEYAGGGLTDENGQTTLTLKTYEFSYRSIYSGVYETEFVYYTPHTVTASNGASVASGQIDMDWNTRDITLYLTGDADADGYNDLVDPDDDNDGFMDHEDAFPEDPTEWADTDHDGIGNNADDDDDDDGYNDTADTFPEDPKEWTDLDNDGVGDNSDLDIDGDGVTNDVDAFPYYDKEWLDTDGDGTGDNEDTDDDGDLQDDEVDAFPKDPNDWLDTDGDGIGDNVDQDDDDDDVLDVDDKFPFDKNEQVDTDGDGIGDNADTDDDNDGFNDTADAFPKNPDEWSDNDGDGIGDNTDQDDDNDGVLDVNDKFPFDPEEWLDTDGDGIGDNADTDDDNDGINDTADSFPKNPDEWDDTDGDGVGDNVDPDDDNDGYRDDEDDYPKDKDRYMDPDKDRDDDGVNNGDDKFPNNPDDWDDTDDDGIGDNVDPDDDNDGYRDEEDDYPKDKDKYMDPDKDRDGDGVKNDVDEFPNNPNEYMDSDDDGVGDNLDQDADNDGVLDINDAFPLDSSEQFDTDNDGLGNNADDDDDGDGINDDKDDQPDVPNPEWSDEEKKATEEAALKSDVEQLFYLFLAVIVLLIIIIIFQFFNRPSRGSAGGAPAQKAKAKPEIYESRDKDVDEYEDEDEDEEEEEELEDEEKDEEEKEEFEDEEEKEKENDLIKKIKKESKKSKKKE